VFGDLLTVEWEVQELLYVDHTEVAKPYVPRWVRSITEIRTMSSGLVPRNALSIL